MPGRRTCGQADRRTVVTPSLCSGQALSKRSAARGPKRGLATKLFGALRSIAGMPDYDAHVEHLRDFHPERPIPTERQFYDDFIRARYEDGPTRCC
jgi:uncharacterized short protein YbdD (DUF466 family)